jgi:hypothetical protein
MTRGAYCSRSRGQFRRLLTACVVGLVFLAALPHIHGQVILTSLVETSGAASHTKIGTASLEWRMERMLHALAIRVRIIFTVSAIFVVFPSSSLSAVVSICCCEDVRGGAGSRHLHRSVFRRGIAWNLTSPSTPFTPQDAPSETVEGDAASAPPAAAPQVENPSASTKGSTNTGPEKHELAVALMHHRMPFLSLKGLTDPHLCLPCIHVTHARAFC